MSMTDAPNDKMILALPSKGRLMEQCDELLKKAGFRVTKTGSARGYRGEIASLPNVEVSFVSSSEIASRLRSGAVHMGITGEDLVREASATLDDRVGFDRKLGFGHADVVVAVPASWLDVNRIADLETMAMAFRRTHGHRLRVATKYLNLTRRFFNASHVASYRIVESLGATEGAPAAGLAELIVDITTTGATLAANGLRVIEDGVILRSQANLVASRAACWTDETRETARVIFDHITARARANSFREVRTRFAGFNAAMLTEAQANFGVVAPFGGPTSSGMITLHCPPAHLHALASYLRQQGAETVSVAALDYVFDRANPLFSRLEAFLSSPASR